LEDGCEYTHKLLDFIVRRALGVKVGTTLTATDRLTGQGVLEDLFETQAEESVSSVLYVTSNATHNFKMDKLTEGWNRKPPL
jgi:hypothetical protein